MVDKYGKLGQQFLCCFPVNKMDWSIVQLPLDLAEQEALLEATCKHRLNQRYPVRRSYQEAFVKKLLQLLKDHEELHDELYDGLLSNSTVGGSAYAYKHYLLQSDIQITLKESNSFVSEGTTGLCTWEASLALADYLLEHRDVVKGKNILELGAGAGLVGMLLKKSALGLHAGQVVLTDGSASCVKLMHQNIELNYPSDKTEDSKEIPQCEQLLWDEVEQFPCEKYFEINLLLAADVIYDNSQFDSLLKAINYFDVKTDHQLEILLASTVRNVDTLHKFMEQLDMHQYQVTPCANVSAAASHFCRDHTAAVQIISIQRKNQI